MPVERFESEEVRLRAPPHAALLDVTPERLTGGLYPQAFSYFDPISRYGACGEAIEAVNVTTLNIYDFSPVPRSPPSVDLMSERNTARHQQRMSRSSVPERRGAHRTCTSPSRSQDLTFRRLSASRRTSLLLTLVPREDGRPLLLEPVQISGVLRTQ